MTAHVRVSPCSDQRNDGHSRYSCLFMTTDRNLQFRSRTAREQIYEVASAEVGLIERARYDAITDRLIASEINTSLDRK